MKLFFSVFICLFSVSLFAKTTYLIKGTFSREICDSNTNYRICPSGSDVSGAFELVVKLDDEGKGQARAVTYTYSDGLEVAFEAFITQSNYNAKNAYLEFRLDEIDDKTGDKENIYFNRFQSMDLSSIKSLDIMGGQLMPTQQGKYTRPVVLISEVIKIEN